jgi:hypothetical protein
MCPYWNAFREYNINIMLEILIIRTSKYTTIQKEEGYSTIYLEIFKLIKLQ